jgi:hypothetical protein
VCLICIGSLNICTSYWINPLWLLQHFILTKRGNIVGGLLFGVEEEGFKHCLGFSSQAGFFRCLIGESRPPGTFVDLEWCYLPVGGPDFCLDFWSRKTWWLAFSGPWLALAGLSCSNGHLSGGGINNPFHLLLKNCPSCSRTRPNLEPPKSLDLHLQPSKALDLWRIEEEDPDPHRHWRNFIVLPIC